MKKSQLKRIIKEELKKLNEQRRRFGPDSPLKPLNCDKFWHNPGYAQDCCKACKSAHPLQMQNSSCLKYCHCCNEMNEQEEGKEHLTGTHIKGDPNANLCQCDDGIKYINCGRECECCDQMSPTGGRFKGKPYNLKKGNGHGDYDFPLIQEQNPNLTPQQLLNHFLNNVNNYRMHCKWNIEPWALGIFALPPFTSTNPNQPCQFIGQRIQHFTNLIAQAGPNSVSVHMWTCKLNFFQALAQFYNC